MAYGAARNNMIQYHNGYNGPTMAPFQNYQNRPQNVRKSGKHEDEEAGKLFVGGLRYIQISGCNKV